MNDSDRNEISNGSTVLGIELGSTRIKAVLINSSKEPIAQGGYDWENQLVDNIWTYSIQSVWKGLQECYSDLKRNVLQTYGVKLTKVRAFGISAMMHGYIARDKSGNLLVPFRTWRNTITGEASRKLTELFGYPVPERWSISHLYQAILNDEPHVKDIASVQTLSSYVHEMLTGKRVLGIGDASGMFPIDTGTLNYNKTMIEQFDELVAPKHFGWKIEDLLPKVLIAGQSAGTLTESGALLLDPSGETKPGIPFCPPEGDAGTGMVATNSVALRTGNVSAGTSVFAMVVLEHSLKKSYPNKIDLVTTPDGKLVAMSHGNNCTGEYDHWMKIFSEVLESMGCDVKKGKLYDTLLSKALEGDKDCGGLLPFNYISGESMTDVSEGRPLFVRRSHCSFTLANFMRAQLFTALSALRAGMDILFEDEHVQVDALNGHGGFFKTPLAGQTMMAAAMHTPISVLTTAGEGGAWGIALLSCFAADGDGRKLDDFLNEEVFRNSKASTLVPEKEDIEGFDRFFEMYKKALPIEREAAKHID